MPWIAPVVGGLVSGATSYFGAEGDEDAAESANKANAAALAKALQFLGTPGDLTYGPEAYQLLGDKLNALVGDNDPGDWQNVAQWYLTGTPNQKAQALATIEKAGISQADLSGLAASAEKSSMAQQTPTAFGRLEELFGVAQQSMQDRARYLTEGYGKAIKSLAGVGANAQAGIIREGKASAAQGQQDLASRGLLNTSVLGQYQRAQRGMTSRNLTDFATAFAPLRAGAEQQLAEARARGAEGLANLSTTRAGLEQQLYLQGVNAQLGVQHIPGPSYLDAMGGGEGIAAFGQSIGQGAQGFYDWWNS